MSTITTRSGKGSTLTFAEVDGNFTNLNTDKLEATDVTAGNGITVTTDTAGNVVVATDSTADVTFNTVTATNEFIGDIDGAVATTIRNTSGGTIYRGQAVYVTGLSGDTPTVSLARSDSASTMPAIGIVRDASILNNASGQIITLGTLSAIDTSASNQIETGITLAVNDILYVSTSEAGNVTNVKPTGATHLIQNLGTAIRVDPNTNMTFSVKGAGRSNDTPNTIDITGDIQTDTSFISTQAPTFTQGDTPIQLTGTQPSQGGYHGHITVDTGVSRGAYTYSSRTAGANIDRHIFFFDLDDDFGARPTGAYQGDNNIWFQSNWSADRVDLFFDGYSTAGIAPYGHGGNGYGLQALELNGNDLILKGDNNLVATVSGTAMTMSKPIDLNGSNLTMGGGQIDLENGSLVNTLGNITFADNIEVNINSSGTNTVTSVNGASDGIGIRSTVGTAGTAHTSGTAFLARRSTASGFQDLLKVESSGTAAGQGIVTINNIDALTNQDTGTPSNTTTPTGYIELLINGTSRYIPYYT